MRPGWLPFAVCAAMATTIGAFDGVEVAARRLAWLRDTVLRPTSPSTVTPAGAGSPGAGRDFDGDGTPDEFRADGTSWWISSGDGRTWRWWNNSRYTLADLAFGDFDGDGRTDVFRADGTTWWVSWAGASGWFRLNTASETLGAFSLGDVDGDGRTDIFRTVAGRREVVWGGAGPWR